MIDQWATSPVATEAAPLGQCPDAVFRLEPAIIYSFIHLIPLMISPLSTSVEPTGCRENVQNISSGSMIPSEEAEGEG